MIKTILSISSLVIGIVIYLFSTLSGTIQGTAKPITQMIQTQDNIYANNSRIRLWVHFYSKVDSSALNNEQGREFYTYPFIQRLIKNGIPIERAKIYTEIPEIESKWKVHAVSSRGAIGIWQVMGPTARHYKFKDTDMFDPVIASNCACQYIAYLDSLFSGDVPSVLFSYNGGENNMLKLFKKYKTNDPWLIPFTSAETQEFAPKILAAYLCTKEHSK